MGRLLGKATPKPSLSARATAASLPAVDPLVDARRTAAEIQSTAAKLVMTRRRVEELRDSLVERDKSQAEINSMVRLARDRLNELERRLGKRVLEAISGDLGDLQAEAMRVTQIRSNG